MVLTGNYIDYLSLLPKPATKKERKERKEKRAKKWEEKWSEEHIIAPPFI